jgi:hypothetical protein
MDTRILIPNIPSTVDERAEAIALRIREAYPAVSTVSVTSSERDGYLIEVPLIGGTVLESFGLECSTNRVMRLLRTRQGAVLAAGRFGRPDMAAEFLGRTDVRGDEARGESGYAS